MPKKSRVYSVSDLGLGNEFAETIKMEDLVGETITINEAVEKSGKYGSFYVLKLSDGTETLAGGDAIVKVIEAAIENNIFPLKARVEKVKSKKRKNRFYYVLR